MANQFRITPSCGWRSCPVRCTSNSAGTSDSMASRNLRNSTARWRRWHWPITLPVLASSVAKRDVVPWARNHGYAAPPGPGAGAKAAWCGPGPESVTSRPRTRPTPGRRIKVEAHNVPHLFDEEGVRRQLEGFGAVRLQCQARQMRLTVVWLRPERRAMDRVLQWVASLGVVSKVNAITRSTSASSIILGRPLRGWSNRPSSRCSRNRERHFPTVSTHTRNSAATAVLLRPSAQARTILARRANAWAVLGRRVHCSKVSRSAPSRAKGGIGLPLPIFILPFGQVVRRVSIAGKHATNFGYTTLAGSASSTPLTGSSP